MGFCNNLRINNLLCYSGEDWGPDNGKECLVTLTLLRDVMDNPSLYKGVRIMPEKLLSLGFNASDQEGWFHKEYTGGTPMGPTEVNSFNINIETGRCCLCFVGYIDAPFEDQPMVYLGYSVLFIHELQNAYFFTSGQELVATVSNHKPKNKNE